MISHELNPVWNDTLELVLASVDLDALSKNASIILTVWDEDKLNEHDLIGSITIPVRDIIESNFGKQRKEYVFDRLLMSNSEVMGKLKGSFNVNGDLDVIRRHSELVRATGSDESRFITLKQGVMQVKNSGACCIIA